MSSIPSSAMPHPKATHTDPEAPGGVREHAEGIVEKVKTDKRTKSVTKVIKDNPKTAAAIGVTVLAGAAAAIAAPFIGKTKPAPKKAPAKKPQAPKTAAAKTPAKTSASKTAPKKPAAATKPAARKSAKATAAD